MSVGESSKNKMYNIPAARCRTEETIKRSRFIATIARAASEEEAKTFIAGIRNEFSDATHNCWAYVAGPAGDTARIGMSDDGEPHGTAGRPILTELLHSDIGEVAAVVTRYFSGTKLGKGGLVRAYSGAVKNALDRLRIQERNETLHFSIVADYSNAAIVKQLLDAFNTDIMQKKYEADVCFEIKVPKDEHESFLKMLSNRTGAEIQIKNKP